MFKLSFYEDDKFYVKIHYQSHCPFKPFKMNFITEYNVEV